MVVKNATRQNKVETEKKPHYHYHAKANFNKISQGRQKQTEKRISNVNER